MVATSLTRNQVVRKGTWVRIPPSPPVKINVRRLAGVLFFVTFLSAANIYKLEKENNLRLLNIFYKIIRNV